MVAAIKMYQFLLLLIFISSTFGLEYGCKRGGSCSIAGSLDRRNNYTTTYSNSIDLCFYFRCYVDRYRIMEGSGTYEDFINTCKYVNPTFKGEINYQAGFMYNDENLILTTCYFDSQDGCEEVIRDKKKYSTIHQQLEESTKLPPTFYLSDYAFKCEYDNTPLKQLPTVQCESGGICQSGKYFFDLSRIGKSKFVTKTCDACVMFFCTLDGKKIIEGTGCYEDFVKACKNIHRGVVERFKEKFYFRDVDIKANFYYDTSMIVASCSDADNCHKYAFDNYMTKKAYYGLDINPFVEEKCTYEEMIESLNSGNYSGIKLLKLFIGVAVLKKLINCM